MIRSDENTLSSLISEKGYPHVKVMGTAVFSKDNTEAEVTYDVDKGPFVKMGHNFSCLLLCPEARLQVLRMAPL